MRVVHIDDSGFQRRIAKKIIEEVFPGAECISLSDADMLESVENDEDFEYADMVVTDLLMDKISGQDVIKYVRQKNDNCFIAVLSSNIQAAEKEKCYQNGADFFIEKPLTADKLIEMKAIYDNR